MGSPSLKFKHVTRAGTYHRVADPDWPEPLDARPALASGGRWNPPGSFPVVYLNRSVPLARLFVANKLRGLPYGPEDLDPDSGPVLVSVELLSGSYVDVVTDAGCASVGLPSSHPIDSSGDVVPHEACQPIGQEAWNQGEPGIACRSATHGASRSDEEMAWFQRGRRLHADEVEGFVDWFFG